MDTFHILNFHPIFCENAFCLSQRLHIELCPQFNPIEGHTYIVFAAHDNVMNLLHIQQTHKVRYIILNGEPPKSNHLRNKYYLTLLHNNTVFDYHELSMEHLKSLGIKTVFSKFFFEFPMALPAEDNVKDIDILFIGSPSPKRESVYADLKASLPDKHIVFEFGYLHTQHQELTKLLHRAKYVLNMSYYDHQLLETHRIHKALACGCEVVSYPSGHTITDKTYDDYVHFTSDFVRFFKDDVAIVKKKAYAELIGRLLNYTKHNVFIINQLLKN